MSSWKSKIQPEQQRNELSRYQNKSSTPSSNNLKYNRRAMKVLDSLHDYEVDAKKNPTILFGLIISEKFDYALDRLTNHPEEAFVWVKLCRKVGIGKSICVARHLPIHIACILLYKPHNSDNNKSLEDLIKRLTEIYPEGLWRQDNNGKYPTQIALSKRASTDLMTFLLGQLHHPKELFLDVSNHHSSSSLLSRNKEETNAAISRRRSSSTRQIGGYIMKLGCSFRRKSTLH